MSNDNAVDEEDDGPNNTLTGLLAKLEDGDAMNAFGHEAQTYIRTLRRKAKARGKRVVGKLTIEVSIPMGPDGYMAPVVKMTTKPIPPDARTETTIYVDDDGDINGLPVPKQLTLGQVKGGKGQATKDPAVPAAKAM